MGVCTCTPILIADDEPFNLMALSGILKQLKTSADYAYDGE